MPLHHHGATPHTKTQQRKRTDDEVNLVQAAGQIHSDVGSEPFNGGRWDQAVANHIAGRTPAPTTGGTLSIQEQAQQVMVIADDPTTQGMLSTCDEALDNATAAIAGAADHVRQQAAQAADLLGGEDGVHVNGQGAQVIQELEALMAQVQAARQKVTECVGYAGAFATAMRQTAGKHLG